MKTPNACAAVTYNYVCAVGYDVMQPILSGDLLEKIAYPLTFESAHIQEKQVGDLIKYG